MKEIIKLQRSKPKKDGEDEVIGKGDRIMIRHPNEMRMRRDKKTPKKKAKKRGSRRSDWEG